MLIGDMRKFLTCLFTLREDEPGSGRLDALSLAYFGERGCNVKTIQEAANDQGVRNILKEGLRAANQKAISKAQHVQDFVVLTEQFAVENGCLTPTLKLKRKEVVKMFAAQIDSLYTKPAL
jgi:long-chain acyl-CoA synthetase